MATPQPDDKWKGIGTLHPDGTVELHLGSQSEMEERLGSLSVEQHLIRDHIEDRLGQLAGLGVKADRDEMTSSTLNEFQFHSTEECEDEIALLAYQLGVLAGYRDWRQHISDSLTKKSESGKGFGRLAAGTVGPEAKKRHDVIREEYNRWAADNVGSVPDFATHLAAKITGYGFSAPNVERAIRKFHQEIIEEAAREPFKQYSQQRKVKEIAAAKAGQPGISIETVRRAFES